MLGIFCPLPRVSPEPEEGTTDGPHGLPACVLRWLVHTEAAVLCWLSEGPVPAAELHLFFVAFVDHVCHHTEV